MAARAGAVLRGGVRGGGEAVSTGRGAEPERYGGERVVLRLGGDGSGERDRVRERKYVDHRSGFETGDVERFRAVRGGIGRGGDAPARSRTLERER